MERESESEWRRQVREWAYRTAREQGKPEQVSDPAVMAKVATILDS